MVTWFCRVCGGSWKSIGNPAKWDWVCPDCDPRTDAERLEAANRYYNHGERPKVAV